MTADERSDAEPSGYTLVCPGVGGYGLDLGRTIAHGADCCQKFAGADPQERERTGLRIPNESASGSSREPSPAELGETMTVTPGEWTPLDDLGTAIYVYGDQSVDVAVQTRVIETLTWAAFVASLG